MTKAISGISPKVLRWARERAGYSLEDVASALGKDPRQVKEWESESGGELLTYVQLEKLAYQVYKRPIAIFFFPLPPEEVTPSKSFRTLPHHEISRMSPDTLLAIRQARAMQLSLYELSDGKNPAKHLVFKDIRPHAGQSSVEAAKHLREYLGHHHWAM